MVQCGRCNGDRLKHIVVTKGDVNEVMVVLRAISGELLCGVIFAMYNAVANVLFQTRDVFEVVEWVVVKEGLVKWPLLIKELIPLVLPIIPMELVCFEPLVDFFC